MGEARTPAGAMIAGRQGPGGQPGQRSARPAPVPGPLPCSGREVGHGEVQQGRVHAPAASGTAREVSKGRRIHCPRRADAQYVVGEEVPRGTRPEDLGQRPAAGKPGVRGLGGGQGVGVEGRGEPAVRPRSLRAPPAGYTDPPHPDDHLITPEVPEILQRRPDGLPFVLPAAWKRAVDDPFVGHQMLKDYVDERHGKGKKLGISPEQMEGNPRFDLPPKTGLGKT